MVLEVIPDFSKKGKRTGKISTMERVLYSLRIILNKEDMTLEEIAEDFGKDMGGNQLQDGDKHDYQEYEPPRGAMNTTLCFILDVISTIETVKFLPQDALGLHLTSKKSIIDFRFCNIIILTKMF